VNGHEWIDELRAVSAQLTEEERQHIGEVLRDCRAQAQRHGALQRSMGSGKRAVVELPVAVGGKPAGTISVWWSSLPPKNSICGNTLVPAVPQSYWLDNGSCCTYGFAAPAGIAYVRPVLRLFQSDGGLRRGSVFSILGEEFRLYAADNLGCPLAIRSKCLPICCSFWETDSDAAGLRCQADRVVREWYRGLIERGQKQAVQSALETFCRQAELVKEETAWQSSIK